MTPTHIGVDISRDRLDIHDPLRGDPCIPNTSAAIRRWLAALGEGAILVFEGEPE